MDREVYLSSGNVHLHFHHQKARVLTGRKANLRVKRQHRTWHDNHFIRHIRVRHGLIQQYRQTRHHLRLLALLNRLQILHHLFRGRPPEHLLRFFRHRAIIPRIRGGRDAFPRARAPRALRLLPVTQAGRARGQRRAEPQTAGIDRGGAANDSGRLLGHADALLRVGVRAAAAGLGAPHAGDVGLASAPFGVVLGAVVPVGGDKVGQGQGGELVGQGVGDAAVDVQVIRGDHAAVTKSI